MAESSRQKVQEKRFGVTLWDLFLRREWFSDSDFLFTKCIDSRKGLFMRIILKCEFFLWQFDCSEVTLYGCQYVKIQLLTNYLSTSIKRKCFGGYLSMILTHTSYHRASMFAYKQNVPGIPNVYTVPPPQPGLEAVLRYLRAPPFAVTTQDSRSVVAQKQYWTRNDLK